MIGAQFKEFKSGEAEAITHMRSVTQQTMRQRGQLRPIPEGKKARLNVVLLAEMAFVFKASKLGLDTTNLTVRAKAAEAIAYWALQMPEAYPSETSSDEREAVARRLLQLRRDKQVFRFLLIPFDTEMTWQKSIWTDDPDSERERFDGSVVMIPIPLEGLGKSLVERAGNLVELPC